MHASLPDPKPGDPIRIEDFEAVAELVRQALGLTVGGSLEMDWSAGGPRIVERRPPEIWGRITGGGTSAHYAWTQVRPVPGGGWEDVPSGASGTATVDYAEERNGNVLVPTGKVRPMRREAGTWRFDWGACGS